jgi:RHS repeat-associated protein
VDGANVDYAGKYDSLQQTIKDRYAAFEVPYHGTDNDDYVNGQDFCCDDTPRLKSFNPSQNDNPELFQYYYHSDHLGSSSLITNLDGEVVQHIEYVPFGEVFIEERNNTWNTPYLFNAKELDEETGLYYYGARYYDPRISLWLSTDPLQEKYPNISSYAYTVNNPIKYIDPDGRKFTPAAARMSSQIKANLLLEIINNNKEYRNLNSQLILGEIAPSVDVYNRLNEINTFNREAYSAIGELDVLAISDQTYDIIQNNTMGNVGHTTYNTRTGNVEIRGNFSTAEDLGLAVHELAHAYDFETGQMSLPITGIGVVPIRDGNDILFADLNDEMRAYRRQDILYRTAGYNTLTELQSSQEYGKQPLGPVSIYNHKHRGVIKVNPQHIANYYQQAFRSNYNTYVPKTVSTPESE